MWALRYILDVCGEGFKSLQESQKVMMQGDRQARREHQNAVVTDGEPFGWMRPISVSADRWRRRGIALWPRDDAPRFQSSSPSCQRCHARWLFLHSGLQGELDAARHAPPATGGGRAGVRARAGGTKGLRAELETAVRRAERADAEAAATRRLVAARRRAPVTRTKFKPGPA